MTRDLEEATLEQEGAEPTSKKEEKPTPPSVEPTVRTYTQKELDEAVGKGSSSIQRQLSIAKAEWESLKAAQALYEEQIATLEAERNRLEEERFAEDPEALKGYRDTRNLELKGKKATLREAELNRREAELEGLRWAITMHKKADELQSQYQVPREILETCTTEEQMGIIAKAFPQAKEEPSKETPPKFDSGLSSGIAFDFKGMTPDEKLKEGFRRLKKK